MVRSWRFGLWQQLPLVVRRPGCQRASEFSRQFPCQCAFGPVGPESASSPASMAHRHLCTCGSWLCSLEATFSSSFLAAPDLCSPPDVGSSASSIIISSPTSALSALPSLQPHPSHASSFSRQIESSHVQWHPLPPSSSAPTQLLFLRWRFQPAI